MILAVAALCAAGCASHRHTGGVGSSEFVPLGPPILVYHIANISGGCEAPETTLGLRLEHRDDGVFRVLNDSDRDVVLYYDVASSFGRSQMFVIRYRDSMGNLVSGDPDGCGWWTSKVNHSSLISSPDQIERERLVIPAGRYVDIPGGIEAIVGFWRVARAPANGPCEAQVRLYGYADPLSWDGVGAVTDWLPAPCPRSEQPSAWPA